MHISIFEYYNLYSKFEDDVYNCYIKMNSRLNPIQLRLQLMCVFSYMNHHKCCLEPIQRLFYMYTNQDLYILSHIKFNGLSCERIYCFALSVYFFPV